MARLVCFPAYNSHMAPPLVRPPAAGLVYRLFDRPLHPELVASLATRRVNREGALLSVTLTSAGHLLAWRRGDVVLTELIAVATDELPTTGQRLGWDIESGERRGRFLLGNTIYRVGVSLEYLPPEVFLHVHEELAADAAKRGFVAHLQPHHRLGLAPLGFVTAEPVPNGLYVQAFHTFPEEFAVLKVQSLIEDQIRGSTGHDPQPHRF